MARLPEKNSMRLLCKGCDTHFFANINKSEPIRTDGARTYSYITEYAVCPACTELNLSIKADVSQGFGVTWETLATYPQGALAANKILAPKEVPSHISQDYNEAISVIDCSPKAAAALSRRCLQAMLADNGYKHKNLVDQIKTVLAESDRDRIVPASLRETLDVVRSFGNFSAHPMTEVSTLQIIDVEIGESEWCLEILRHCFEVFYVEPKRLSERKAKLNAKLQLAGKPPLPSSI